MEQSTIKEATKEIEKSLTLVLFAMRQMGLSFDKTQKVAAYFPQKIIMAMSICTLCCLVISEFINIIFMFGTSPTIENIIPMLHILGYGILSSAKFFVFLYKKDELGELIHELAEIWPMPPLDEDAANLKRKSLTALQTTHRRYFTANVMGVWFYISTPIIANIYKYVQSQETHIGYIWYCWYPFDKREPIAHVAVYIFEAYAGINSVWIMMVSDLFFSGMASHITLLLRILQRRLESLGSTEKSDEEIYEEICSHIKLHQRLINYCNSLEEAYSIVNLINIMMSSVNICCVVFVIVLLEPIMAVSNKLFLASVMLQIGALCWYADDILHENANVSTAAYTCSWYKMNTRCRRALLFLIFRSQIPIAFTALKFTDISLVTYSSILTRSYSYFALLYTMYKE